jgi:hypothetical protein
MSGIRDGVGPDDIDDEDVEQAATMPETIANPAMA